MNIYDLHSNPGSLNLHKEAQEQLPMFFFDLLKGKKPTPKQERAIAKDAKYAYIYAHKILGHSFPAGEAAIAAVGEYSYLYAKEVLSGPFPAGEAAIAKNANYSYFYACEILNGPFPAGEAAMVTDPRCSCLYAINILKGPFPAGEAAIATDTTYWKKEYKDFLEEISYNSNTLLLHSIRRLLKNKEKIYLDFMEGDLVQKGLIIKIDKNIVYAKTKLGVWFVQDNADEHFTLRKVNNKFVVQKV